MNDDSPSRQLAGAHRPSGSLRIHALKPYARPASFTAAPGSLSTALTGPPSPTRSPTKALPAPSTRLPRGDSASALPRSGSESSLSLVSGLKSMLSRPLAWLATPSRAPAAASKRDSLSSFGHERDLEAADGGAGGSGGAGWSPLDRPAAAKRARRHSPGPAHEYEPDNAIGRAVSGFMLPPLPPHVSLARPGPPGSAGKPPRAAAPPATNYARPLTSSSSMPYLDPPLSGSPARAASARRAGPLTRSRRVDLASLAADADGGEQEDEAGDVWSPWKQRPAPSTGARSMTPQRARAADAQEVGPALSASPVHADAQLALPSLSPFRAPPSPSASRFGGSGLTRSATTANIDRQGSVASDVSMGFGRAGSARLPRASSTLRLSAVADDRDDRMSVDGGSAREGSVLDWFMQDRWNGPASPVSVAGSRRHGSAAPSSSVLPPIRKGQMVWDADKGFVRQAELEAVPKPVQQNDAERILFALESMRKPTLIDASQPPAPVVRSLAADFLGSSSRSVRRGISVPLPTAQAEESARKAGAAAVARRNPANWDPEASVSNMISPYGRRKQVDRAARDERRERSESERQSERPERPSSVSIDRRSERSEQSTRASRSASRDERMSVSDASVSPGPQATPRRSTRNRRAQPEPEPEDEPTPRPAKRGTRRTATAKAKEPEPQPTRRTTRSSRRKQASPSPAERETTPPPPPQAVPTITETAPSPSSLELPARASTYEVRADDAPRERSSLRARSEMKHRSHQGAASYASSRATSPSGGGRFSARDEDLPTMEELEQTKIPLVSFAGIKMPLLSTPASPAPPSAADKQADAPSLLSRLGAPAPAAQPAPTPAPAATSAPAAPSLSVPAAGGLTRSLNRVGTLSTRPRASSPLAANSIIPDPDSPPAAAAAAAAAARAAASTTPASKPPAFSFGNTAPAPPSNGDKPADKPTFSFGLGKPPAPAPTAAPEPAAGGGMPDFFGRSRPGSGTTTPTAAPPVKPFDFGLAKPAEPPKAVVSTFSLGSTPAPAPAAPAANGDAAAPGPFAFGKPSSQPGSASTSLAEPAKAPFSFGSSAGAAAEPAKSSSTFAFGAPAGDKAAEPAKPSFGFGAPADKPASSGFGFTQPAKPTDPAAASTSPFGGFGSAAPASGDKGKAGPAAAAAKPAFSFGAPADKPAEPNRFAFGAAPAATPAPATNGSADKPAPFAFGASTPASPAPAAAANPFATATNGTAAPTAAPSTGFGFSFNKPDAAKDATPGTPAAAPASPFGAPGGFSFSAPAASGSASSAPSAPTGFGQANGDKPFAFGASNGTPAASPAATAPPTPSFSFGAGAGGSGTFGAGASAAPASSTAGTPAFTFGGAGASGAPPAAQPFAFGAGGSTATAPTQPASSPFGTPAASPFGAPAASPFGQPAAPAAAPANPFGGASQPAASPFGTGFSSAAPSAPAGFGVVSPPPTSNAAFSFGAPSPAAAPTQPFAFGAPTAANAAPPSPGGFAFGAPAGSAGAPAPAPAGARFASPAPSDGGFSLGVAGDAPGSPSGRKIKPLRRAAAKR